METHGQNLEEKAASSGALKYEKKTRDLIGWRAIAISAIAVSMSLFHIWVNSIGIMSDIHRNAVHLGFLLALAFLTYPARKGSPTIRFTWTDVVLALLSGAVGIYILLFERYVHLIQGSVAVTRDYIFAVLAIVLVFEGTRRTSGFILVVISVIFILFAVYGNYIPGVLGHAGVSWKRFLFRMFLTYEGLWGITLTVSSTFIFLFLLFGAFLQKSGVSQLFNDLAFSLGARRRGGPAQVAVIASCLFGTISGSAVANVATTGTFTIPLMKKTGYKPHFAGAVEASASTGGIIMPPIMGAVAFVMAGFLGVSYAKVALAAIVPALLYYASVSFTIDLEAKKLGLRAASSREDLPSLKTILLKRGYLLLPLVVICYVLVIGRTALFAAFAGIMTTLAVSWVRSETRMGLREIVQALDQGARSSIQVGIACAVVGFIVGVSSITGLGSTLTYQIAKLAGNSLFTAMLLIMAVSIILSMGLPGTALYIIVAVTAAPALIKLGSMPLAAHFFVLWFGAMTNLTPPVALASYAAAALAGSEPFKTAWTGFKLAAAGFIIPMMFVFQPILLLQDVSPLPLILAIASALVGVYVLAISTENFFMTNLRVYERLFFFIAAILLIKPGWKTDLIGFILMALTFAIHAYHSRKEKSAKAHLEPLKEIAP
jgi:TRAP transporter 4TM/12TM fusion protein